jgi:hypothetical protein
VGNRASFSVLRDIGGRRPFKRFDVAADGVDLGGKEGLLLRVLDQLADHALLADLRRPGRGVRMLKAMPARLAARAGAVQSLCPFVKVAMLDTCHWQTGCAFPAVWIRREAALSGSNSSGPACFLVSMLSCLATYF